MVRLHLHRRGQFDKNHRVGPASWPYFDLLWIHKGHVSIRFQSRQKAGLHAGQGVLIYPHTRFEGYSVTPETQASVQHFELLAAADELPPPFSEMTKLRRGYELYVHPRAAMLQADVDRAMELARREAYASAPGDACGFADVAPGRVTWSRKAAFEPRPPSASPG